VAVGNNITAWWIGLVEVDHRLENRHENFQWLDGHLYIPEKTLMYVYAVTFMLLVYGAFMRSDGLVDSELGLKLIFPSLPPSLGKNFVSHYILSFKLLHYMKYAHPWSYIPFGAEGYNQEFS